MSSLLIVIRDLISDRCIWK